MAVDYIHRDLNQEVTAAGGHYVLVKEMCLPFQGREVLVLVGYTVFDTACCGMGGCSYAVVPGFVLDWRHRTGEDGWPVSRLEPVRDKVVQEELRRLIGEEERGGIQQILFQ
jgi:hypothetical protein